MRVDVNVHYIKLTCIADLQISGGMFIADCWPVTVNSLVHLLVS